MVVLPEGIKIIYFYFYFFFNDTATTEIYTLSLHDALPISSMTPVEFKVVSAAKRFKAEGYDKAIQFTIKLELDEIVLVE